MFVNKKYYRALNWFIKVVMTVGIVYLLYRQVWARDNAPELWVSFKTAFEGVNVFWLLLAIFSMPINWGLEARKWQKLVEQFAPISYWSATKSTYAGAMTGTFTPNRVGEFGGKILWLPSAMQAKGIVASFVGSAGQFIAILLGGVPSVLYFLHCIYPALPTFWLWMLFSATVLLLIVLVFFFYNIDLVLKVIKRLPIPKFAMVYVQHVKILKNYSFRHLSLALWYSILRYMVYALQYYCMLHFFDISIPWDVAITGIATVFLFQTIIPLPSIAGLLVRGEVALQLWGFFTSNHISILSTTFGLWFINVIFPALIGWLFILNKNVVQSLGYEEIIDEQ